MNIGTKLMTAKSAVTSTAGLQLLKMQKNSPALLFGAGVIGVVGTVVLASRATLKLSETMDEFEEKENDLLDEVRSGNSPYTETQFNRDYKKLKAGLVLDICQLYLPAVGVGALSIAALTSSHVILTKRNTSLMAAYAGLQQSIDGYRKRVRDHVGEEEERKLYHGVRTDELAVEGPNGTEVQLVDRSAGQGAYEYEFSRQTSKNFDNRSEYNYMFLKSVEVYANEKLTAHGKLLLDDVLEALGMDPELDIRSHVVGWVKGNGDGFVDFGVFDPENEGQLIDFMTGRDKSIMLNFNVDGVVFNLEKKGH